MNPRPVNVTRLRRQEKQIECLLRSRVWLPRNADAAMTTSSCRTNWLRTLTTEVGPKPLVDVRRSPGAISGRRTTVKAVIVVTNWATYRQIQTDADIMQVLTAFEGCAERETTPTGQDCQTKAVRTNTDSWR
jgi:hypothetical protein